MPVTRVVHTALTVGALLGPAGLVGAGPAAATTAATGYDRCPVGHFCAFTERDGQGYYAAFRTGWADLREPINGHVFDRRFSSIWNRTPRPTNWFLYEEAREKGASCVVNFTYRFNLPDFCDNRTRSVASA